MGFRDQMRCMACHKELRVRDIKDIPEPRGFVFYFIFRGYVLGTDEKVFLGGGRQFSLFSYGLLHQSPLPPKFSFFFVFFI